MSVFLKRMLGMALAPSRVFVHCNTGISRLIWDRNGVLVQSLNDTSHIPGAILSGGGENEGWWPSPGKTEIRRFGDIASEDSPAYRESLKLREEHLFKRESLTRMSYADLDERSIHFLAYKDDRLAGFVQYDPEGNRLRQLLVLSEFRGNGVGQELVAAVREEAMRHGQKHLFVHSWKDSSAFYAKCGFVLEGEPYLSHSIVCQRMRYPLHPACG